MEDIEAEGAPADETMAHHREAPKMTAGRAALVELMRRYLAGWLDPFIALLEARKLMYFMQEAGGTNAALGFKKAIMVPTPKIFVMC